MPENPALKVAPPAAVHSVADAQATLSSWLYVLPAGSAEDDQELRAGLWRLRRWGAQTSYPVLMAAYDLRERGLLTIERMREVVSYIESFLVRRQLAGIPTNVCRRQRWQQARQPLPEWHQAGWWAVATRGLAGNDRGA